MTDWYTWPSEDEFDAWHADACTALGIPHPGVNQATGEIDEDAQWTTAYTSVVEVAAADWRAYVEASVAELVPDGLGAPSEPPPAPEVP
jgi:hypothetical protein